MEILTVVAILLGPILAIVVANVIDKKRATHSRRMDVFRILMRTRRSRLTSDHVSALNLVEIEFQEDNEVIEAWRTYFEHLGSASNRNNEEQIIDSMTPEQKQVCESRYQMRIAREREKMLANLLFCMSKRLNYKIEALDIFEGGYSPQGWAEVESQHDSIRRYMIELLSGARFLPVLNFKADSDPNVEEDGQK